MAIGSDLINQLEAQRCKNIASMMAASQVNYDTFNRMKGSNWGKDVVICGAGPTLNKYSVIEGASHVALNRALLKDNIRYDWFVADDWKGIDFFQEEIIKYDCKKLLGRFSDELLDITIPESFGFKCGAEWFYTDLFLTNNGYDARFVVDIDRRAVGSMPNIALVAIQIVLFTMPKRIYLVGCDATSNHYICDDVKVQNMECVFGDKVIQKWRVLKKFAEIYYPDTQIISINPVGLKGIFEDWYQ